MGFFDKILGGSTPDPIIPKFEESPIAKKGAELQLGLGEDILAGQIPSYFAPIPSPTCNIFLSNLPSSPKSLPVSP